MDDKTRAREYYDEAVTLLVEDCGIVIERLERALKLHSDSYIQDLIGNVWHYLLKSLDRGDYSKAYKKYTASPAWRRKRDQVIARDKGKCAWCGAEGKQVHHKTYDNIGRESLSDLVLLCNKCHNTAHPNRVSSDNKSDTQQPYPPKGVQKAFIAYIERESGILQLGNFDTKGHRDYVDFKSGYPTNNRSPEIYLSAWLPIAYNDVAAIIAMRSDSKYFQSHYKKLEAHKSEIEDTFSFEEVKFRSSGGTRQLRVVKKSIDMTQPAERDAAFRWLRENLEKLYWVLHVHDTLGWGDP